MEENLGKNSSLKKEFESLLAEDLSGRNFKEGEIVTGTVEEIGKNFVYLDLGLKSSSAIPIEEFKLSNEIDEIKIGSKVKILHFFSTSSLSEKLSSMNIDCLSEI